MKDDLTEMRERAQTFIVHRELHKGRTKRGALTVVVAGVAATAAARTLLPKLIDRFCPFNFMCGDSGKYDELAHRLSDLDDMARTVTLESGERIHLLGHALKRTQGRLKILAKNLMPISNRSGTFSRSSKITCLREQWTARQIVPNGRMKLRSLCISRPSL